MAEVANLQLLRALVMVAREGSVSQAASRLCLSQPAVSLQLKALSEQTGLTLFARAGRGLSLTPDGAALLPKAESVLASLAEFNHGAVRLQQSVRGVVRVGTILDPGFTRLGAFLKTLVERAPQIGTELRQAMSGSVLEQVCSGALDVGFHLAEQDAVAPSGRAGARAQPARLNAVQNERGLASLTLTRFSYRVVGPPAWAQRLRGQDWKGLATLPWLATPVQSVHHRLLASVFGPDSTSGVAPHYVALVDQEASMLDLVKSGVGLSLMRDSIAIRESQTYGLAVADGVGLDCTLRFICLAQRRTDPIIESAWNAMISAWRLDAERMGGT